MGSSGRRRPRRDPLVLQANEHLRDDSLAVGHSTSSIDGQDIELFASLNVVGGP
jgi:hypothetical protein